MGQFSPESAKNEGNCRATTSSVSPGLFVGTGESDINSTTNMRRKNKREPEDMSVEEIRLNKRLLEKISVFKKNKFEGGGFSHSLDERKRFC